MTAAAFHRFRAAFGQYSGLFTLAGFALIIVFSAKYIQLHTTLNHVTMATAMPAAVTQVSDITCTRSLNTSIQSFNVQQRCLEVNVVTSSAPEGRVARHIVVEQSNVGELTVGDRVFVVPARTGVDSFFIVNAQDEFGFMVLRYAPLGYVLLGVLVILASFLVKRYTPVEGAPAEACK
jgi:hypothetical protein